MPHSHPVKGLLVYPLDFCPCLQAYVSSDHTVLNTLTDLWDVDPFCTVQGGLLLDEHKQGNIARCDERTSQFLCEKTNKQTKQKKKQNKTKQINKQTTTATTTTTHTKNNTAIFFKSHKQNNNKQQKTNKNNSTQ